MMGRLTAIEMEFRHYEGAFYTLSRSRAGELRDILENPFGSRGPGVDIVWDAKSKARHTSCWPNGIIDQFEEPYTTTAAGEICLRQSELIELEPGQERVVQRQALKASKMMGHFLLIDGKLWERSP